MERNGYSPSSPETSVSETDASSDNESSSSKKKKKTGAFEAVAESSKKDQAKKEQVAEKTKDLLDKLVGIDPDKKPDTEAKREKQLDKKPEAGTEQGEADDNSVENLSEAEQAEVIAAYAPARIAELEAGRDEAEDPADAAAREADIAYLKQVLETGPQHAVSSEAIADGGELAEVDTETIAMTEVAPDGEPEQDMELVDRQAPAAVEDGPSELPNNEPIPLGGSARSRTQSRPTPTPGGADGAGNPPVSGANLSPRPPIVPPHQYGTFGQNPNALPVAAANLEPSPNTYTPDYRQNPNASYLLVGGVVGYLIGKRRGRIKTEKKMKVVQRKLEKQVEAIQSTVAQKELEVQKLAREQYWQQKTARAEQSTAAHVGTESLRSIVAAPAGVLTNERTVRLQPESQASAERQARRPTTPEARSAARREAGRVEVPQQIQELDKQQLLSASEKIKIGSTNLKRIYEAKLISESGLKRLVTEHIENKDIRRGLAREFLAKELSYERDPRFRDLLPPGVAGAAKGGTATGGMSQSGASDTGEDNTQDTHPNTSKHDRKKLSDKKKIEDHIPNGLLAALTLLALGLAVYAVLLSLTR